MSDKEQPTAIGCRRTSQGGPLTPGSTKDHCADCATEVWIAPVGRAQVVKNDLEILCVPCLLKRHPDEDFEIAVPPEQLPEIKAALQFWYRRN
jgi:hypothetical protein